MGSPLPPDPYAALGVPKDATPAAVKTAHRKLVLKCHPDKVTDPAEKQAASDKFHKIQSAYEILIDENRRERYDAQVRLAELKKEALASRSRGADRSTSYRTSAPAEAPRGYATRSAATPQCEERRPAYAASDYFEPQPRPTPRKESEPVRASRRPAHDVKEKSKSTAQTSRSAKDQEKERKREKTRQPERDPRQERERKHNPPFVVDADSDSESDEQEHRSRRLREEDEERRAKETYYAQMHKQRREAEEGYYNDERARKLFTQTADIRDYIATSRGAPRRPEPSDRERERERERERRPSPVRMGSSKDGVEYVKRKDGRPAVMVRRASSKQPKESSSKDKEGSRKASTRTPERSTSDEKIAERRPPPLTTSKSSPADIHVPEKPRAASVQINSDTPPVRTAQRTETMPTRRSENAVPTRASNLRTTEMNGGNPTSATIPDEQTAPPPKYSYGRQYADDNEIPTPDGYRTEQREPEKPPRPQRPQFTRRITRSPSPMKGNRDSTSRETREPVREARDPRSYRETREAPREATRERDMRDPRSMNQRTATQAPPPITRTTSYKYNGNGVDTYEDARANSGRDASPREPSHRYDQRLYGELPRDRDRDSRPASGSPRQAQAPHAPPVDEGVNYRKMYRPEDIKYQTGGYSTRRPSADIRPTLNRNTSGHVPYYQQTVRA